MTRRMRWRRALQGEALSIDEHVSPELIRACLTNVEKAG